MQKEMEQNLTKSLEFCDRAAGCGLLFFPEIQLSPFFPQYEGRDVGQYCLTEDSAAVQALAQKAAEHHYYFSLNVYLEQNEKRYDTSLWISPEGEILDKAKMYTLRRRRSSMSRITTLLQMTASRCSTPPLAKSAS